MKARWLANPIAVFAALLTLSLAACGTLEVGMEKTPAPPTARVSPNTAWAEHTDPTYRVSLRYPAHWRPVEGYPDTYGGPDGFFQLSAVAGIGQTLGEVCRSEAYHQLLPYGSHPEVENVRIGDLFACRILPSDDQPADMNRQAAMVFVYPQPVRIGEDLYHFFILRADKEHLLDIAQTVRFTVPEPTTLFSDPVLGIAFDIPATWQVESRPGAEAQFTLSDETGVARGVLTLSVLSEGSTTLDGALDEVRRGAWGPFIGNAQPTTLGEFPALRVEMTPEGDQPSVIWLIVAPSGRAVSFIPRGDPALAEMVLATLRAAPTASPVLPTDLGMLAYVRGGDIWVKALPYGEPHRLTTDGRNREPRWSPSGQWLAFRKGEQVWMARADGSDMAPVAEGIPISAFAWAPDQDRLAYVRAESELYVIHAGKADPALLLPSSSGASRRLSRIAWSPDGRWIAYEWRNPVPGPAQGRGGIGLIPSDGGKPKDLVLPFAAPILVGWTGNSSFLLVQQGMSAASLLADGSPLYALSPDQAPVLLVDQVLAYSDFVAPEPGRGSCVAIVSGGGREAWTNKRLVVVTASTGNRAVLSTPDVAVSSPSWSPDGTAIAYVAAPDTGTNIIGGEEARRVLMGRRIFVVNTQGPPQPRQVTDDPAYRDERPLWSRDGTVLLFVRMDDQGQVSLWLVPSAGGTPRRVVDELTPAPDWFGYYGHVDWDDLFDWWRGPVAKAEARPPDLAGLPPDLPSGLVLGTESGLWKIDRGRVPTRILDRPDVVLSPDGTRAVYVADTDLWLMDLTTGGEQNLTRTPDLLECCPQWWPARPNTLVYGVFPSESDLGPSTGLLTVMEIGHPRYLVVGRDGSGGLPGPGPDGDTIAFDQGLKGYLFRWSDGRLIPLDPASYTFEGGRRPTVEKMGSPSWSPDGRYLAWVLGGDFGEGWRLGIGVFDLRARTARLLHSYEPLGVGGWPGAAVWSPDGAWLAYVVWPAANPDDDGLYVLRPDGSKKHSLGPGRDPVWSPDGRWLAFRRGTDLWLADTETWNSWKVAASAWPVMWLALSQK